MLHCQSLGPGGGAAQPRGPATPGGFVPTSCRLLLRSHTRGGRGPALSVLALVLVRGRK